MCSCFELGLNLDIMVDEAFQLAEFLQTLRFTRIPTLPTLCICKNLECCKNMHFQISIQFQSDHPPISFRKSSITGVLFSLTSNASRLLGRKTDSSLSTSSSSNPNAATAMAWNVYCWYILQ